MTVYKSYSYVRCGAEYEIYSKKSGNTVCSGAFSNDDTLTVSVRVPRALCAFKARFSLYRDDDMSKREFAAELTEFAHAQDVFSVTLNLSDICLDKDSGLFYWHFCLDTPYGTLYTARDGNVTHDEGAVSSVQLTVFSANMYVPDRFRGGMMYQIFVDRFYNGEVSISPDKGKILNPDWENGVPQYAEIPGQPLSNNEFFGGNLWGVAKKLDYIASLGVDTLYLCPIFEAASNHKYDTGDYMKIDRMFGGEEAFDNLISECKLRGIKVILDGVFNHTGDDSVYFNKFGNYDSMGACDSVRSPYYKWYSFEKYPSKYNCWWGIDILPAVKSTEPSYREFICGENGVVRRYLRRGINGWRLDVADELSDVFLDELKSAARKERADSIVFGEVWEDASNKVAYDRRRRYFRGKQLDSVMNYPLKEAVTDFIIGGDCTVLIRTARELWAHYPEAVSHVLMNFLGTHDTERILTVLADAGTAGMTNRELAGFRLNTKQRRNAKNRLKLAWALLASFPGIPCIYYGDEVGMEGGRDPFNRMPYVWGREDKELLAFYRKIGKIRKKYRSLFANGDFHIVDTGSTAQFMLTREYEGQMLVSAVNLADTLWEIEFDGEPVPQIGRRTAGNTAILAPHTAEYFIL